jgi:hypothetical protein
MAVRIALLAALVLPLMAAPVADARLARHYFGQTQLGGDVTISAQPDRRSVTGSLGWRMRCPRQGWRGEAISSFSPPRYATSRREFAVVISETASDLTKSTVLQETTPYVEVTLTGLRRTPRGRPGSETWSGALQIVVEFRGRDDNRVRGTCRSRSLRWTAWREGHGSGRWNATSTPNDYVGGGADWRYDNGNAEIMAYGDRRDAFFYVLARDGTSWSARFTVPEGQALVRGRRFVDDGEDGDGPSLDVSGSSRSCSEALGEWTVRAARYDRRGRLRDLTVEFEQRCGAPGEALRGTLTFRSLP